LRAWCAASSTTTRLPMPRDIVLIRVKHNELDSGARARDRRRAAARDVCPERPPISDRRPRPRLPRLAQRPSRDARARARLDRRRRAHRAPDAARTRLAGGRRACCDVVTGSSTRSRSHAARRCRARCSSWRYSCSSRCSSPRGAPTAFGTAIGVNLVQGWFPTGDAAPRVTLPRPLHRRRRNPRAEVLPQQDVARAGARRAPRRLRRVDAHPPVDAVARADRPGADEPLLRRLRTSSRPGSSIPRSSAVRS